MSSMCSHVCVLIFQVSVLIMLIFHCQVLASVTVRLERVQSRLSQPSTHLCLSFVRMCVCVSHMHFGRDDGEFYEGRLRHAGAQCAGGRLCEPGWKARGGRHHLGHQWGAHHQPDQCQGQSHAAQTLGHGA